MLDTVPNNPYKVLLAAFILVEVSSPACFNAVLVTFAPCVVASLATVDTLDTVTSATLRPLRATLSVVLSASLDIFAADLVVSATRPTVSCKDILIAFSVASIVSKESRIVFPVTCKVLSVI